jgi:hypothetical protein
MEMAVMNAFKVLLACVALIHSGSSMAALEYIEETLEVSLGDINVPDSANSQVRVRPCDQCELLVLRVSPKTVYRLDGFKSRTVPLAELHAAIKSMPNRSAQLIYVAYAIDTKIINSIVIDGAGE